MGVLWSRCQIGGRWTCWTSVSCVSLVRGCVFHLDVSTNFCGKWRSLDERSSTDYTVSRQTRRHLGDETPVVSVVEDTSELVDTGLDSCST